MRQFRVGVFEHQGTHRVRLEAYTVWFSPDWPGCCVHHVEATNGTIAKRIAKDQHRLHHMPADAERRKRVKA